MSDYISTHWGTYKFSKDKNNKIKLDNWELDLSPTEFGLDLVEAAIDDLRIKQPYIRKGWLDNEGKSDEIRKEI
jgi:biotin/methionine sulfoxide reductase